MTNSGESRNEKHGNNRPDWLPSGLTWNVALVLLGFMLGMAIMFWLAVRFGW
jgi:hypothetical protein